MKFIARFLYVPLAGLLVLTSCAKEETESYDKFENQALEAWMTQHRSDQIGRASCRERVLRLV